MSIKWVSPQSGFVTFAIFLSLPPSFVFLNDSFINSAELTLPLSFISCYSLIIKMSKLEKNVFSIKNYANPLFSITSIALFKHFFHLNKSVCNAISSSLVKNIFLNNNCNIFTLNISVAITSIIFKMHFYKWWYKPFYCSWLIWLALFLNLTRDSFSVN